MMTMMTTMRMTNIRRRVIFVKNCDNVEKKAMSDEMNGVFLMMIKFIVQMFMIIVNQYW